VQGTRDHSTEGARSCSAHQKMHQVCVMQARSMRSESLWRTTAQDETRVGGKWEAPSVVAGSMHAQARAAWTHRTGLSLVHVPTAQ
jgi:hypothetical protein